jgi:hypothetical protein
LNVSFNEAQEFGGRKSTDGGVEIARRDEARIENASGWRGRKESLAVTVQCIRRDDAIVCTGEEAEIDDG